MGERSTRTEESVPAGEEDEVPSRQEIRSRGKGDLVGVFPYPPTAKIRRDRKREMAEGAASTVQSDNAENTKNR